jgi:hypothetical protein
MACDDLVAFATKLRDPRSKALDRIVHDGLTLADAALTLDVIQNLVELTH